MIIPSDTLNFVNINPAHTFIFIAKHTQYYIFWMGKISVSLQNFHCYLLNFAMGKSLNSKCHVKKMFGSNRHITFLLYIKPGRKIEFNIKFSHDSKGFGMCFGGSVETKDTTLKSEPSRMDNRTNFK